MEENFVDVGLASYIFSRCLKFNILVVPSLSIPDYVYLYSCRNELKHIYYCSKCRQDSRHNEVTVTNGRIYAWADPEPFHENICLPIHITEAYALHVQRFIEYEVRSGTTNLPLAYTKGLQLLYYAIEDPTLQHQTFTNFPTYVKLLQKPQLTKTLPKPLNVDPNINIIDPITLQVTEHIDPAQREIDSLNRFIQQKQLEYSGRI